MARLTRDQAEAELALSDFPDQDWYCEKLCHMAKLIDGGTHPDHPRAERWCLSVAGLH